MQLGVAALNDCVEAAKPWPIDGLHAIPDYASGVWDLYNGTGPKPLTTGWPELDRAFKVLAGQFILVTGIPNHGKSQFLDQLAVQMADLHGLKWAVFSPEGGGVEGHIATLAEVKLGRPFHDGPTPRMERHELQSALDWIGDRFWFIDAKEDTPTIDWILQRAKAAVLRHGINALIIDPYNEIEASRPRDQSETEFVSQLISKCKRFAAHHDVTVFVVAHPTKLVMPPGVTKLPAPGLYDIAGSAHWNNKCDAGIVVYRDFEAGVTSVISRKIRKQPICGIPASVSFFFNPGTRKFEAKGGSFTAQEQHPARTPAKRTAA